MVNKMELRKDYILDRYVILSAGRKQRPMQFEKKEEEKVEQCFFCPGKESLTPPEIGRIEENGKWIIRWFPNKFPAVDLEGSPKIRTDNHYYTYSHPYGYHEVVAETNDHSKQMWDFDVKHIAKILKIYRDRIKALSSKGNIKYICLFKNSGLDAGTSIIHSHTQIIAYNKIPELVADEVKKSMEFSQCPYCDVVNLEKNSERRCFENDSFVAFCPYASRFHYEIWIFPKKHIRTMEEFDDKKFNDLALIMQLVLLKLKKLGLSYNFQFHYSPSDADLHFHIEICPRDAVWGGFELLSNDVINSVIPEDAAKFYRGEDESNSQS
jgi:UDPglucose--hexose-1-phosphate uridylyltransferase